MDKPKVKEWVIGQVAGLLHLDPGQVGEDMDIAKGMEVFEAAMAAEETFGISLPNEVLIEARTVGDLVNCIFSYLPGHIPAPEKVSQGESSTDWVTL